MKKIAVLIIAAVMTCFGLVGCGSGGYTGKWELQEMSGGGMTLSGNLLGIPVAVMFQFEFKEDGTGTLKTNDEGSSTFKWEEKDGGIVVTPNKGDNSGSDGDDGIKEMKFTKDGDLLVCTMEKDGKDATIKLTKVDEFTTYDASSFSLLGGDN